MKKVVDRFAAKDANGRIATVLCVMECFNELEADLIREVAVSFETTEGERLFTDDHVLFRIADTSCLLHRVGPRLCYPD